MSCVEVKYSTASIHRASPAALPHAVKEWSYVAGRRTLGRTLAVILLAVVAGRASDLEQLPYANVPGVQLGSRVTGGGVAGNPKRFPARASTRRVPEISSLTALFGTLTTNQAVPLPLANTLCESAFSSSRFGQALDSRGRVHFFNPQCVLAKFRRHPWVSALRTAEGEECQAIEILRRRDDVDFAELDIVQQRQFVPNDPHLPTQWHHSMIGSFEAWERTASPSTIRVAVVDTPFQMDHPDLAGNTVAGWDIVSDEPVLSSPGIDHSTLSAGLITALINNGIGVAGVSNCRILPINVNGATSEIYNAIVWAADHDVRIVSVSWTGADSAVLNDAGFYLKTKSRGILAMAGVNGTGWLDYPSHPNIYAISMTDAADNMRSSHGNHIDFAAPGWEIFSTAVESNYATGSGTSYSTPLFAGIAGALLTINPALGPEQVIDLIKSTAVDNGQPGWDPYFGWGRVNFGAAVSAATATLPRISSAGFASNSFVIVTEFTPNATFTLWKKPEWNSPWSWVSNAIVETNGVMCWIDPSPAALRGFYRLQVE